MGRSVSTPYRATLIAYDHIEWDDDDMDQWDDVTEYALERIQSIAPTMAKDKGWAGREDQILASNCFATFGVSEYCGLIAYWMIPSEDYPLAVPWLDRLAPKFDKTFSTLNRIGVMSNGEGVYRRR